MVKHSSSYDVCIIGSGPSGLACLSAIREPYSIDLLTESQIQRAEHSLKLHHQLSVCVIDPEPNWMNTWKTSFEQLNIQHLRSPAIAHPNMFDRNALLAFAVERGRESELNESGCSDIKSLFGLGQTQVGLWKLPSTKLFLDFCDDMVSSLAHTYLQGRVVDLLKQDQDGNHCLQYTDPTGEARCISTRNVILTAGTLGRPILPCGLVGCPTVSWNSPEAFLTRTVCDRLLPKKQHVLVVGGGLTAVQAALRVAEAGNTCVLCSRRPLRRQHFDIPVDWFDQRKTNKCLSGFYHDTIENRLEKLKEARDGGSVPPMYMKRLEENKGRLSCWVGDVEYHDEEEDASEDGSVTILFEGSPYKFDKIVLACGIQPDCKSNPLVEKIHRLWPIPIHGGLPDVTEDLRWHDGQTTPPNLFVTGAMAGLQVGPDAGNLMGIRRAALVVANSLECRSWLREKALVNPFEALGFSDSDTESESASYQDCSTCCEEDLACCEEDLACCEEEDLESDDKLRCASIDDPFELLSSSNM
jgi:hypothetical protein